MNEPVRQIYPMLPTAEMTIVSCNIGLLKTFVIFKCLTIRIVRGGLGGLCQGDMKGVTCLNWMYASGTQWRRSTASG